MEYSEDMKKRLRRVEGQLRRDPSNDGGRQPCKDVVSQLSAVRSAVESGQRLYRQSQLGAMRLGRSWKSGEAKIPGSWWKKRSIYW